MNETKLFGNSNFICNNNLFDVRPKNLILILKNDKLFYQNNNKKNLECIVILPSKFLTNIVSSFKYLHIFLPRTFYEINIKKMKQKIKYNILRVYEYTSPKS